MLEIQDTLVSLDIFSQHFCCDLSVCKGCCCVEGDAGAPVEEEEIAEIEDAMEVVWEELTPEARNVIEQQGVVYPDPSGELVTSIVNAKDCVFANHDADGICYCVLDRAYREGSFPSIASSKSPSSAALVKPGGMNATLLMANSRRQDI